MRCVIVLFALISNVLCRTGCYVPADASQEFITGNQMFTGAIYKELLKGNPDNLIVSPFSAETILSLVYEGARGETATEFITGLSLPNTREKVQRAFKLLLPKLRGPIDNGELKSVNKIYLGSKVMLEEDFKSIATDIYNSGIENVDFSKNVAAANKINKWVEEETNDKIKNLVDSNEIDARTKIILINTLYLQGYWASGFEMKSTLRTKFFVNKDVAVDADLMYQQGVFNYWENKYLDAKFLELPLRGTNVSMVIVLPNKLYGLAHLEEHIEEILKPQPYRLETVDLGLPRFSVESKIQFVPIIENLGIQRVFTAAADLTGISSTDRHLYISDITQKVFINVTEFGIEAASATEVNEVKSGGPLPITAVFNADHPFIYYIKHNDLILFAGRFVGPSWQPYEHNSQ